MKNTKRTWLYCRTCKVYRKEGEHRVSFKTKHKRHDVTFVEIEEAAE